MKKITLIFLTFIFTAGCTSKLLNRSELRSYSSDRSAISKEVSLLRKLDFIQENYSFDFSDAVYQIKPYIFSVKYFGPETRTVRFKGMIVNIPKNAYIKTDNRSKGLGYTLAFRNSEDIVDFSFSRHFPVGCVLEEDRKFNQSRCAAFSTEQEYYDKMYSLTVDRLLTATNITIGDFRIFWERKFLWKNSKYFASYHSKKFKAYRKDIFDGEKILAMIQIFPLGLSTNHGFIMVSSNLNNAFIVNILQGIKFVDSDR